MVKHERKVTKIIDLSKAKQELQSKIQRLGITDLDLHWHNFF